MHLLLYGPGRLGSVVAAAAMDRGWTVTAIGRPPADSPRSSAPAADVVVDASLGTAVVANVAHAAAGGNRSFVIAATGWDADLPRIRDLLLGHDAAAVAAANLSLGAALFLRLVERAAAWYASADQFEPSVVEWHRRGKADRPSATARALARRIAAADPRWAGPDEAGDPAERRQVLEVAGIRAGSAPGSHLVTFDGAGESVELRLTARDRTAYAAGALAAAGWLTAGGRAPGLHPFEEVVDALLAEPPAAPIVTGPAVPAPSA